MAGVGFLLICAIAFTEVASWTIDLPEARKYYFEKYGKNQKINNNDSKNIYDNIEPDSPHNKEYFEHNYSHNPKDYERNINYKQPDYENDVYHSERYADEYEYQTYRQKEVAGVMRHGSVYLEGLRLAIEQFGQLLNNCTRTNGTDQSVSNTTWLPENERPSDRLPERAGNMSCEQATRAREHVRRLSALALWATRELQDRAYADKYQEKHHYDEEEEKELLLRLAWFLDRLAVLTGYHPRPEDFTSAPPKRRTTSPLPPPFSVMQPLPEDAKRAMMECLHSNSSEHVLDRCMYPLPLPALVRQALNITDEVSSVSPTSTTGNSSVSTTNSTGNVSPAPNTGNTAPPMSAPELLMTGESRQLNLPLKYLTSVNVKSVRKRSIDDNPLLHVMKYYAKHKVWVNSNPEAEIESSNEFHIENDLTAVKAIQKRSINNKKSSHLRLPENPMQDLSSYVKTKKGIRYLKDQTQAEKINIYLDKIRHGDSLTAKRNVQELVKKIKSVQKRSIEYGKMVLPQMTENPMQDLSYYVKNKPGTEYNNNLVQAAQVRVGLEQVFQRGNIEVVRRYGTNYNPAIPNPLYFGVIRSFSDI